MITEYARFEGFTLSCLSSFIAQQPTIIIGDITLKTLALRADSPHGIYIAFNERRECMYVGRATSRSFIERIPTHFDPNPSAWMNQITKKLQRTFPDYRSALEAGLSLSLHILSIPSERKLLIHRLERCLRYMLAPKLNKSGSLPLGCSEDSLVRNIMPKKIR